MYSYLENNRKKKNKKRIAIIVILIILYEVIKISWGMMTVTNQKLEYVLNGGMNFEIPTFEFPTLPTTSGLLMVNSPQTTEQFLNIDEESFLPTQTTEQDKVFFNNLLYIEDEFDIEIILLRENEDIQEEPLILEQETKEEEIDEIEEDIIIEETHTQTVKGIYLPTTKWEAIDEFIELANTTEINSFVLDMKNDKGYFLFSTDNPLIEQMIGQQIVGNKYLPDVLEKMENNDIHSIARVVAFKDSAIAKTHPDQMIKDYDGNIYTNAAGETWLNPYDERNWEYLLEVCKEVIALGFDEIQFDYIRFHESMNEERVDLPTDKSKAEIITEFTTYMVEKLSPYDVTISASVFGTILTSDIDAQIVGQDYSSLVYLLDAIYPMVYPSHYSSGWYGQENPDLAPYEIILGAMIDSNKKVAQFGEEPTAKVMPWLQDFTATWLSSYQRYEAEQILEQINGVYDAGLEGWVLWNASGNYTTEALLIE
ncbi:MAG: hypothetical protein ATN36_02320 [Epulopiscium sp. Nele67-Bin005]|nr:MAG: hypothetical protein ATN36_02320 [Epulopiscium sp. Nele67-Bin005]